MDTIRRQTRIIAPASYIIYKDGTTIKVFNGTTDTIDYSGTNAAIVIQNAINSLANGTTYIRQGIYTINDTIIPKTGVNIIGEGVHSTILRLADNTNKDIIKNTTNDIFGITIADLTLDGNKVNNVTAGHGLWINSKAVFMKQVLAKNCREYGIRLSMPRDLSGWIGSVLFRCRVEGCGGSGFRVIASDTRCVDCTAAQNINSGFELVGGATVLQECHSWGNHDHGVWVQETVGSRIIGGSYESNNKSGIWIYGYTGAILKNIDVIGATCWNNSKYPVNNYEGISINANVVDCIIKGVLITGCRCCDTGVLIADKTQRDGIRIYSNGTVQDVIIVGNYLMENRNSAITNSNMNGSNFQFKDNMGYKNENKGVLTDSGTGSKTQFTIIHGLVSTPNYIDIQAKSSDAAGYKYWFADVVNITITFITPPPSGTNNVVLSWKAEI